MKFAIRDDDTAFFTQPEELEEAYSFVGEGPISLSIVPYSVPYHEKGVHPYGDDIDYGYYPVGDNHNLVSFLKEGNYDLMLHGYSHEYRYLDGVWYPEMLWKEERRIQNEMKQGKEYLEYVFQRPMKVFIAPNNAVDQKAIRAVEANGLHYSGIIQHLDRDISFRYAENYVKRWLYRLRTGYRIPDVLDYGGHKEMVSYPLDSYEKLIREYELCKEHGSVFSIYTHYWQLNKNPGTKKLLTDLYEYMMNDGAVLVSLSSCFGE